jgi:hypothetical protein
MRTNSDWRESLMSLHDSAKPTVPPRDVHGETMEDLEVPLVLGLMHIPTAGLSARSSDQRV